MNNAPQKRPARDGFTLIEVMISLVVLAFGLLALAQLQIAAVKGLAQSRHLTVATQLAEDEIEYLKTLPVNIDNTNATMGPRALDSSDVPQLIVDADGRSVLFDPMTGNAGDGVPTLHTHVDNPLNEWGAPHLPGDGTEYFVRWWVERGGSEGTPVELGAALGFPGAGEMALRVEIFWWEGDEERPADLSGDSAAISQALKDLTDNTAGDRFLKLETKAHQVSLETVRVQYY